MCAVCSVRIGVGAIMMDIHALSLSCSGTHASLFLSLLVCFSGRTSRFMIGDSFLVAITATAAWVHRDVEAWHKKKKSTYTVNQRC